MQEVVSRISSVINILSIYSGGYQVPANEQIIQVTKQYHYFPEGLINNFFVWNVTSPSIYISWKAYT